MSDTESKTMEENKYFSCQNKKPLIMGILNITEDSFYDGGKFLDTGIAVKKVKEMLSEKADILDIGAESSRPFSKAVSEDFEIERILSILDGLKGNISIPISIDTSKSKVAKEALKYKEVKIINDIYALRRDGNIAGIIADANCKVILMHMKGIPSNMQNAPYYENVIDEILSFFEDRITYAVKNGIKEENIILDPGIGFGKNLNHNLTIIKNVNSFKKFGLKLLIGPSRKSFIGEVLNLSVSERLIGTAAVVSFLTIAGIDILRVHDVLEMKQVSEMINSILFNKEVA